MKTPQWRRPSHEMSVFNLMQRRKFSFKQLQNSQLSLYPRPISFKFLCYTLSWHWNLLTANKNPGKQSMQTNKLVLAFEHTVSNEMKTCEIYEWICAKPLRYKSAPMGRYFLRRFKDCKQSLWMQSLWKATIQTQIIWETLKKVTTMIYYSNISIAVILGLFCVKATK